MDDHDWQDDQLSAFQETLPHLYDENERLRTVAKIAILVAIVTFIVCGTILWGGIGRCGS